ncbi:hypothetical protein Q3G72_010973 [Acer saccharum]|nr:hypothetical protein Q3G72_010973 [Acer saccharum]
MEVIDGGGPVAERQLVGRRAEAISGGPAVAAVGRSTAEVVHGGLTGSGVGRRRSDGGGGPRWVDRQRVGRRQRSSGGPTRAVSGIGGFGVGGGPATVPAYYSVQNMPDDHHHHDRYRDDR